MLGAGYLTIGQVEFGIELPKGQVVLNVEPCTGIFSPYLACLWD